jgi:hypothetical protein
MANSAGQRMTLEDIANSIIMKGTTGGRMMSESMENDSEENNSTFNLVDSMEVLSQIGFLWVRECTKGVLLLVQYTPHQVVQLVPGSEGPVVSSLQLKVTSVPPSDDILLDVVEWTGLQPGQANMQAMTASFNLNLSKELNGDATTWKSKAVRGVNNQIFMTFFLPYYIRKNLQEFIFGGSGAIMNPHSPMKKGKENINVNMCSPVLNTVKKEKMCNLPSSSSVINLCSDDEDVAAELNNQ